MIWCGCPFDDGRAEEVLALAVEGDRDPFDRPVAAEDGVGRQRPDGLDHAVVDPDPEEFGLLAGRLGAPGGRLPGHDHQGQAVASPGRGLTGLADLGQRSGAAPTAESMQFRVSAVPRMKKASRARPATRRGGRRH